MTSAWFEGRAAARDDRPISDCPWQPGDHGPQARAWRSGWLQAEADRALRHHPKPMSSRSEARRVTAAADPTSILDEPPSVLVSLRGVLELDTKALGELATGVSRACSQLFGQAVVVARQAASALSEVQGAIEQDLGLKRGPTR